MSDVTDGEVAAAIWAKMDEGLHRLRAAKAVAEALEISLDRANRVQESVVANRQSATASDWKVFTSRHSAGDRLVGVVASVERYGLFVFLPGTQLVGQIDATSYVPDGSTRKGSIYSEWIDRYSEGDDIAVEIVHFDVDRCRIALRNHAA